MYALLLFSYFWCVFFLQFFHRIIRFFAIFLLSATPKGASVPSLGLSNKAVFDDESIPAAADSRHVKDQYPDNYFVSVTMDCEFPLSYLSRRCLCFTFFVCLCFRFGLRSAHRRDANAKHPMA